MLEYILRGYTEIKEGAQQIMAGKVLESWQERTKTEAKEVSEIQPIYDKLIRMGE